MNTPLKIRSPTSFNIVYRGAVLQKWPVHGLLIERDYSLRKFSGHHHGWRTALFFYPRQGCRQTRAIFCHAICFIASVSRLKSRLALEASPTRGAS